MDITIFAKKMTNHETKQTFYRYISKLKKKTGEDVTVNVKFKDECGSPKGESCPMNITIDKSLSNYSEKEREYTDSKTGEVKTATERTLWVGNWKQGEPYVDTSMDEFED